jgi:urea transport system substrate-binding protein
MNIRLPFIIVSVITLGVMYYLYKHHAPRKEIYVGVLFTTKGGSFAKYEKGQYEMLIQCIHIYNSSQTKYTIIPVYYNPEGDLEKYKKYAEQLVNDPRISVIFGCRLSSDKNAIKPILEKKDHLLLFPAQYEGEDCSKSILYFGACPNQQVDIGIQYAIRNIDSNIVLIGSNTNFPKKANQNCKRYIKEMGANLVDEMYFDIDFTNFQPVVQQIMKKAPNGCCIINTLRGESNEHFYKALYEEFSKQKKNKDKLVSNYYKVMSFTVGDNENQFMKPEHVYETYGVWNYNQLDFDISINRGEYLPKDKKKFHPRLKNKAIRSLFNFITTTKQIVGDTNYHVWLSFYYFAMFLEQYHGSLEPKELRKQITKIDYSFPSPVGMVNIKTNNHLSQPVYILRVDKDKRYKRVYKSAGSIDPRPWLVPFSKVIYKCDNDHDFLGRKYEAEIMK